MRRQLLPFALSLACGPAPAPVFVPPPAGELVGPPLGLKVPAALAPPDCAAILRQMDALAIACNRELTTAGNDCDIHDHCPSCIALEAKRKEKLAAGCR